jgi:hypothetical protein
LLRGFPGLNAALWKLPGMFFYALAPKNLILGVQNNDADIGAISISINHVHHPSFLKLTQFFHISHKIVKYLVFGRGLTGIYASLAVFSFYVERSAF